MVWSLLLGMNFSSAHAFGAFFKCLTMFLLLFCTCFLDSEISIVYMLLLLYDIS